MRILIAVLALSVVCACLCACNTVQGGVEELRNATGGFVQGADTYGVSRRPDLYGRSTQPTTPSMGFR
jgi:hypothetical protein